MLVLSRKPSEHIVIGDNIRVFVQAVHGSKVVLGIDAPQDVRVRRSEYLEPRDVSVKPSIENLRSPEGE